MVTTFEKMTGFGVEGYSSGSPVMVLVSVDTSTKLAAIKSSSLNKRKGKERIIRMLSKAVAWLVPLGRTSKKT
jgi:hypothetical protein